MTYIIYTSVDRNDASGTSTLASGHSDATSYAIDFAARVLEQSPVNNTQYHRALDGSTETTHLRHDTIWNIETSHVTRNSSDWYSWLEFLHSVRAGESFSWHPYNASTDSPNGAYSGKLNNAVWGINRVDSFVDKFRFSFQILSNANL